MEQKYNQPQVPCLPESAPFTPEQRAYLNGFLAGFFSRALAPAGPVPPAAPLETLTPLSILFGSQTGNAENLAKRIAREAGKRGFASTVHDLGKYPVVQFVSEERLLIVTHLRRRRAAGQRKTVLGISQQPCRAEAAKYLLFHLRAGRFELPEVLWLWQRA